MLTVSIQAQNDNNVNMENTSPRTDYHHGDLRRALLETGVTLLEQRPDDELGLRELARAVGVSATAVYRHFPDKRALFAALAETGFEMLADAQAAAARRHRDRRRAFRASGQAYVRFALAHPALFRLMGSYVMLAEAGGAPRQNRAACMLREHVAAVLPAGTPQSQQEVVAIQAWALVHGLAVLMLGGKIPVDDRLIDTVVDEFRFGG